MAATAEARMPEARITDELVEAMRSKAGTDLRIDHSIMNEEVTRLAAAKFVGGIGDINPLWSDAEHASRSPYGAPVAPPTFVIGCFSGIQFGWPGLGSFHSSTVARFHRPVYRDDVITPTCQYLGFDGPKPSSFAGQMVIDHFQNRYTNQLSEVVAEIDWDVINYERGSARSRITSNSDVSPIPHPWTEEELLEIEDRVLAEQPRGSDPRFFEDVTVGESVDTLTKGPIGLTDEIAFVAGGGAPIPRLMAHAAALHEYRRHPAWAFRDPLTGAKEPIYSVHYNRRAANAMGVAFQYDVGFQRQCWQVQHLTHWCSDAGWVKQVSAEYRRFVYLSDMVKLSGTVVGKRVDDDGEHVVDIETQAMNQRGENVMPGRAEVALPSRTATDCPAAVRARMAKS